MTDQRKAAFGVLAAMVAVMWVLELADVVAGGNLDRFGIQPRETDSLPEIVSAPFLHVGFGHLIGNTVPFAAMGAAIALAGVARLVAVTAIVGLVSGLGVWLLGGANSIHLGASGLVFGFAAYLISRGFFSRRLVELAIGAAVVAVFGITLLAGLVPQERVSWEAHFFGAAGGVLAGRALSARRGDEELRRPAV